MDAVSGVPVDEVDRVSGVGYSCRESPTHAKRYCNVMTAW